MIDPVDEAIRQLSHIYCNTMRISPDGRYAGFLQGIAVGIAVVSGIPDSRRGVDLPAAGREIAEVRISQCSCGKDGFGL